MNAKKLKEINQSQAYQILNELLLERQWDPVITNRMSDVQCGNRYLKAIDGYFDTHKNILTFNKYSAMELIETNKEIIPMMQGYKFNKYKEENEHGV